MHRSVGAALAIGLLLLACAGCRVTAQQWSAIAGPDNSLEFAFVRDQAPVFTLGVGG